MENSKFDENLQKSSTNLQNCQKDRDLKSCLPCKEWESCEIRKEYVESLYKKMAKGEIANFDF